MTSDRVQRYKAKLSKKRFSPMSDSEVSELRSFYGSPEFKSMMGGRLSPEIFALLDMFIQAKAPPGVCESLIKQFVCEELVLQSRIPSGQFMH